MQDRKGPDESEKRTREKECRKSGEEEKRETLGLSHIQEFGLGIFLKRRYIFSELMLKVGARFGRHREKDARL